MTKFFVRHSLSVQPYFLPGAAIYGMAYPDAADFP